MLWMDEFWGDVLIIDVYILWISVVSLTSGISLDASHLPPNSVQIKYIVS